MKDLPLAIVQLASALVAGLVALLLAPHLASGACWRQVFGGFFTTAAAVIAALLVAIAIEARDSHRKLGTSLIALAGLAVGEVSALTALTPVPQPSVYDLLLFVTVGGGVAGLVTTCVISVQTLTHDQEAARRTALDGWVADAASVTAARMISEGAAEVAAEAAAKAVADVARAAAAKIIGDPTETPEG
ncbi:MAG TPA: hypothetical protein VGS21_05965 [Acidimicrobiales bacterium]|nr:hypothetical protein [Acidimicrobiales bacterium]